ncbi:MAG: hypothetical protein SynsKO_18280 [Synoicihabitans sp.]
MTQETGQGKRVRLYLKIRALLVALVLAAGLGYLASAVALTLWLDRRPHNLVSFWDISLPWRWSQLNELRGEGYGHHGLELLNEESYQQGIFYLRRSFNLKPDNESGRLALAELYAKSNYYDGVRRTLEPQLEFRFSRAVAETLFTQSLSSDDLPYVIEKTAELRMKYDVSDKDRLWLVDLQVNAYLLAKQLDLAAELLESIADPDLRLKNRMVQVYIGLQRYADAWAVTETIAPALPGMEKVRDKLQAMVRSAEGLTETTLTILQEILKDRPNELDPWLFGIETLSHAKMDSEARLWIGDYLNRFAAKPGALARLFTRVAGTNNVAILRHTAQRIGEWQAPQIQQRLLLALVLMEAGEWDAIAADFPDVFDTDVASTDWRLFIRAALEAVQSEDPPELLAGVLNRAPPRLIFARSLASGFAKIERWDLVKLVTDAGLLTSKRSIALINWRAKAEEKLAEMVTEDLAADAAAAVVLDDTEKDAPRLEWEIKQAVKAENWAEVDTQVLRIRRQNPVWLRQVLPTLDWAEAHVAAARNDYERLRVLAPSVLRNDGELAGWFTDQAVEAAETGYEGSAIRLLEVILEEERYYHRARGILKELTAEPEE